MKGLPSGLARGIDFTIIREVPHSSSPAHLAPETWLGQGLGANLCLLATSAAHATTVRPLREKPKAVLGCYGLQQSGLDGAFLPHRVVQYAIATATARLN